MKIDLLTLLKLSKIFSSLDDAELINLLKKFKKIRLDKDQILFRQGELSNHLYLLVSGKIAIFLTTETNETLLINEVLPGTLLGEITALSHEPRSATAQAVKKSLLLQLSSEDFIQVCKTFNSVSLEVINTSLSESRNIIKLMSNKRYLKKHIAIMPANNTIDFQLFHDEFLKYENKSQMVFLSDTVNNNKQSLQVLKNYIETLDKENITIVYLIKSLDSELAELCFGLERVDMIYIIGTGNSEPFISQEIYEKIDINKYKIKPEFILLHQGTTKFPKHTSKWLKLANFNLHHHIRITHDEDWQRLLRFMTGNAIGVVLGGGGLRCWAQLGALRALKEANIPIDIIGGASAGAIVAGYFAMKQSFDDPLDLRELSEITRKSISFKNFTWPSAALFNGKNYTQKLQEIFGEVRIENLWIPCFCVSTNLSSNKQVISRKGNLWKVIRSSTAVPLVFPPIVVKGKLHLDGGLLNNLPVDIMKKIIKGRIIAVELTKNNEDTNNYYFPSILPFWQTMLAKLGFAYKNYKFPHLIDTFLKSLLAGASAKQEENGTIADLLITPDLSRFSILNVKKRDENELIKIGYDTAIKQIKMWQRN